MPGIPAILRFRPPPLESLSQAEHAILLVRWVAYGLALYSAAAVGQLGQLEIDVLLAAVLLYLMTLEALVRIWSRFRRRALELSILADLILLTLAMHALSINLTSLYSLIIITAAFRFGRRPTLLVALASSIISSLISLTSNLSGTIWSDISVQTLTFFGVGISAAYLGELRENERREKLRSSDIASSRTETLLLVSHEFRTPLAMIKGAVDLLLEGGPGPVNGQQLTFLTTISDSCERLIKLSESQLSLAWLIDGKLKLERTLIDVRAPVRNAVSSFRPVAAKKNQIVSLDYPQVVPKVSADEYWIHQVMTNLLSNASKYTTDGGHIYVSVHENQLSVLVSVTDDGAGISRAERQRIFEPFFRGGNLHAPGTGLGLTIVQHVVDKHGGKVLIDTTLGQGTTLLFTLPKGGGDGQT